MIRARRFRSGLPPSEAELADWSALRADDQNLLWIDLEAPTEQEFGQVGEMLGIDQRTIHLARRLNRRPTVRVYQDHRLVTVVAVDVDESGKSPRISVVEVDLVIGRNYLLSIHKRPLPFAEDLEERTATNPFLGTFDSDYLTYVFLDSLVSDYAGEFEEVERRIERLEEQLLREPGRSAIHEGMLLKRHLFTLRRLIAPHHGIIGALIGTAPTTGGYVGIDALLRDLMLHLDGQILRLDHAGDQLSSAYNLYLSNISHRTNQQLKVLTFVSSILLPMTVITGLFGTNFRLAEYEHWEPFYVMLGGMALIAAAMLALFRWRRWL